MQLPRIETSGEVFVNIGTFHIAMLSTEQELNDLNESFTVVQNNLQARITAKKDAEVKTIIALAKRIKADTVLDKSVKQLEAELFKVVERHRDAPLYKKIFSKGLSWVVKRPIIEEIEEVKKIEVQIENAPDSVKSYLPELKEKRGKLEIAVAQYNEALRIESACDISVKEAKLDWLRVYESNYADLIKRFPLERQMVDTYFKKINWTKETQEDVTGESQGTV